MQRPVDPVLLACLAVACAAGQVVAQVATATAPIVNQTGSWRAGRATFYGGPESYLSNFADRGPPPEYGFGSFLFGSCGYTSQAGNQPVNASSLTVPQDMVAAAAVINADYPGSCGRCYEARCQTGLVAANYTANGSAVYHTISQGYEPARNVSQVPDTFGRLAPVNPLRAENLVYTRCWNDTLGLTTPDKSIYIKVTDSCPCLQINATTGQVYGVNQDCCGSVQHFDLSFYAFQRLAHPNLGLMSLQFRPVDCYTKQPVDFLPGYINETIYSDSVQTGWGFLPYSTSNKQLQVPGAGIGGSNATCLDVLPQGGLTFEARDSDLPGYQPLSAVNATTINFAIKSTTARDIGGLNSGSPAVPPLQLSLSNIAEQYYCQSISLASLPVTGTQDGYSRISYPLQSFNCDRTRVTALGFQNIGSTSIQFCLDDVRLVLQSGAI